MNAIDWAPPTRLHERADVVILTTNRESGLELRINVRSPAAGLLPYLSTWTAEYLQRLPDYERMSGVTFFYILAATPLGRADGLVGSSAGVIEVGYGTTPTGPADGREISLIALTRCIVV